MGSISESGTFRRIPALLSCVLAVAAAAMLWMASSAGAAELLYWDNYEEDNVAFANIDGSGGGPLNLAGVTLNDPEGMAFDSVTNRLYVASSNGGPGEKGEILFVNLDGTGAGVFSAPGAPVESPEGIAVDPVTRMIYWANGEGAGSIAWARLDGSSGGVLNTTGATFNGPYKIALDPVAGRIYWANYKPAPEVISFANADNSGGGGDLNLAGATPPEGITALVTDPAGGRIYWLAESNVSFASLGGGSGGDVGLTGSVFDNPYGLALDPSIGRLYWANYGHGEERIGAIGFASTAGGGGAINIATAPVKGPQDPVILKSPSGTGAPEVTRSSKSRSSLSCSTGGWAADFAGSFVYQSPRTLAYQWTRNGTAVSGATAATLEAKSAGKYACSVTATNQAGSASQTSAAINVKAAKLKLTVKKATAKAGGTAKFKVKAVNQGDIKSKNAKVCVKVPKSAKGDLKAPKCKSLGKLKGRGKRSATLKMKVGASA
ncbi:MAG TPA: hypothetical protein VNL97_03750, partial [Solirubrobacterales bacterium]|nr:hypothetical protein [Solirubrobacterales bacterium]